MNFEAVGVSTEIWADDDTDDEEGSCFKDFDSDSAKYIRIELSYFKWRTTHAKKINKKYWWKKE